MAPSSDGADTNPARATLSGLCSSLVGIGLARFAYTPLIPALIAAEWFSPGRAAYLGAANLAGYLAGAVVARPLAARLRAVTVLRAMMVVATAAFFACATPRSFAWYFAWRFAAGIAGGTLMALAAPTVMPHVPPSRRGLAGGVIFTGVGLGIAASGTLVPLLMRMGLVATWCGLGVLALALTGLAWSGWPDESNTVALLRAGANHRPGLALGLLSVEYGLDAAGLVPHMVFLVDFIARGLGRGLGVGASYWIVFGLGAMVGPVLAGQLADRIGFARAVRLAFLAQAAAVAALVATASPVALFVSSAVVGALVPGIVPLVLGRVHELIPDDPHRQAAAWSVTTVAFALGQAGAGYGFSFLYAQTGSYAALFAIAAATLAIALAIDLIVVFLSARSARFHRPA